MITSRAKSNFLGAFIFALIVTLNVTTPRTIPYIQSKLPAREIVTAKKEITLYKCEDFGSRQQVAVLGIGDTAQLEFVACGTNTRWGVILPSGERACYAASDEENVTMHLNWFYYF